MLENELVTVVITTHKRMPQIVERAILSVIRQTYTKWELIVVDDSPKDFECRKDVMNLALRIVPRDRITFIQNETCRGACYSRNIGLARAKGEYIAYLDDDDEWLPEKLEKQVEALRSNPNAALVYGPYIRVFENNQTKELIELRDISGMKFRDVLFAGNCIGGMSMPLLRTQSVLGAGGFDEQMQSSQDTDLWLRIICKDEVLFLDCPLVNYYIHDGEQIGSSPVKKIRGIERINEKYEAFLENDPELWWQRHSILIMLYERNNEKRKALSIWWQCTKKCPWKFYENILNLLRILRYRIEEVIVHHI